MNGFINSGWVIGDMSFYGIMNGRKLLSELSLAIHLAIAV